MSSQQCHTFRSDQQRHAYPPLIRQRHIIFFSSNENALKCLFFLWVPIFFKRREDRFREDKNYHKYLTTTHNSFDLPQNGTWCRWHQNKILIFSLNFSIKKCTYFLRFLRENSINYYSPKKRVLFRRCGKLTKQIFTKDFPKNECFKNWRLSGTDWKTI